MKQHEIILAISKATDALVKEITESQVSRLPNSKDSMPSLAELQLIMNKLKSIFFPAYLGDFQVRKELMGSYLQLELEKMNELLREQIRRGYCYECNAEQDSINCEHCSKTADEVAVAFISSLPMIKRMLNTDVVAAYNGDPAAKNFGEVIYCYPVIHSLIHHRVAHELLKLGVPLIPRIISEMAHSSTGIDIHPGAKIGEYFTIDHGTGVVIGETCIIGKNVKIYQGVTLGARSFPLDENGQPVKGIDRHPIVEDDVVIYANATILGRIRIAQGAVIGANVWVTEDVPAGKKINNL